MGSAENDFGHRGEHKRLGQGAQAELACGGDAPQRQRPHPFEVPPHDRGRGKMQVYDGHGAQRAYVQGSLSGGLQSIESQAVLGIEG